MDPRFGFWCVLGSLVTFGSGCATAPPAPPVAPAAVVVHDNVLVPGPGEQLLSKVISAELSGIDLEQEPTRGELIRDARAFLRYRSGGMAAAEKNRYRAACSSAEDRSAFCDSLNPQDPQRQKRAEARRARRKASAGAAALSKAAVRGDLTPLLGANEAQLLGALKRVQKTSQLARLEKAVNQRPACLPPALLSAVGMKMEQALPDAAVNERVMGYYERAVKCGPEQGAAVRARYRLALLLIAAGKHEAAAVHLDAILAHPEGIDYRSRAIYWRHACARQLGQTEVARDMRTRMLRDFPMSLHGLLMGEERGPTPLVPLERQDALVRFRSELRPDLNPRVRAAEAVQAVGGDEASLDLIEPLLEQVREAEPAFQLYVAVLLRRSGDVIRKFQLLSALLRESPDLISRQSLEMLFPLRQFALIRAHEERADPFLVVALMRQESAFNTRARSSAGAMGLMQLMPATARRLERVQRRQLFDPSVNIRVGIRYFSGLLQRFGGEAELALAAYNAGPDRVDEWVRRYPMANRMLFVDLIPFRETREYVASIARNYFWYTHLYGTDAAVAGQSLSLREPASAPAERSPPFAIFRRN